MSRFFTLATAAALAVCIGATWSHGDQAGGGAGGSGGAGAGGQAGGAGGAGTAGGTGQAGAAGTAGQAGTGGVQTGANAAGQSAITPQLNDTPPNTFNNFGIGRRPFFADPNVQRQLNLNQNQFNQLNRSYLDALGNLNQGMTGLNNNLTDQQRAQQMMQLQNRFNTDFTRSVDSTFTDPRLRTRFNQLSLQFQGPAAFNDPMIRQRLNLTPQQQREFRRLSAEWRQQLQRLRRAGNNADPQATQQQFAQLQAQFNEQMGAVLTPQQQQMSMQIHGSPFVFPFNSFVDDAPPTQSNLTDDNVVPRIGASQQPQTTPSAAQNQQNQNQGGQGTVR